MLTELLAEIGGLAHIGVTLTFIWIGLLGLSQLTGKLPFLEPMETPRVEWIFDRVVDWIHSLLVPKVVSDDKSPQETQILVQLSLGLILIAMVVFVEVTGLLILSTAVVITEMYAGISPDLVSLYRPFIASLVVLTFALMEHSRYRIQDRIPYA